MKILYFKFIPILLVFLFGLGPFATGEVAASNLSISLDQTTYTNGDFLRLEGEITNYEAGKFVILQVINPTNSDFAHVDTFLPDSDGSFSRMILAEGPKWLNEGTYTINLFYDDEKDQIQFAFNIQNDSNPESTTGEEKPNGQKSEDSSNQDFPQKGTDIQSDPDKGLDGINNTNPQPYANNIPKNQKPKTHIHGFPSLDKSPLFYFERYQNEQDYRVWFNSQFPENTIEEVVGYKPTHIQNFPDNTQEPQYYISRYFTETQYQNWFNSQFPGTSIYKVLGFPDPLKIPDWIKTNAKDWSTGKLTDNEFISGIQFLIENQIIVITNLPDLEKIDEGNIPVWLRNNASWWALDKISEDDFVNGIKFLIEKGVIVIG